MLLVIIGQRQRMVGVKQVLPVVHRSSRVSCM
jgi:hypothetical protein